MSPVLLTSNKTKGTVVCLFGCLFVVVFLLLFFGKVRLCASVVNEITEHYTYSMTGNALE